MMSKMWIRNGVQTAMLKRQRMPLLYKFIHETSQSFQSSTVLTKSKQDPIISMFNPTGEHQSLRNMVRSFVEAEVDPQALEYNKQEKFNVDLFRKLGECVIY